MKHVATGIIAMTPPGVTRYAGGYDYYHEKVSSVQVSGVSGEKKSCEPETRNPKPETSPPDRKDLRKQRALERQALHEKTKDLKKAIKRAEGEVERLETEKTTLSKQLETPDPTTNFASINRRIKEIQYEIDIATGKWEKATEELEKVVGEQEG